MRKLSVLLVAGALLLAACGDNGDDGDPLASGGRGGQATDTTESTMGDMAAGGDMAGMDHSGNATANCSPSGTSLSITASDTKFDKTCLAVPAGQAFTITFDNKDSRAHNIVLLKSHTDTAQPPFRAELIQGPKVETLNVGVLPLPPGTYAFHCEVHPSQMSGTLIVQ